MKVKDLMHNGVETLPPDTSMLLVAKSMKAKDIGAIAIQDKDQLMGIITDRDIVLALADGHDLSKLSAGDVMSKDVEVCRDTDQISDAVKMMESRRIRRLPVIDHHKKLVGMIGIGDISHKAPHDLAAKVVKAVSAHH
jgi:predicted transcriptional regulator